jgi:hypothetical protein
LRAMGAVMLIKSTIDLGIAHINSASVVTLIA